MCACVSMLTCMYACACNSALLSYYCNNLPCAVVLYTFSSCNVALRVAGLFKDYCGVLNEESIRMNFTLVYEILDEVIVSLCSPS